MDNLIYNTNRKTHAKILLVYRIGVLLFASILTLERWLSSLLSGPDLAIILVYGLFQLLVALFFIQATLGKALSVFAFADILIACLVTCYTGGIKSPLVICCFISIFSLHFICGTKGLIYGILVLLSGFSGAYLTGGIQPDAIWFEGAIFNILTIAISIITVYIIPCIVVKKHYYLSYLKKGLEERLGDMDDINTKLLLLFEMMGRMSYEAGLNQNIDKILLVAKEVFSSKRACIFLVLNDEIYSYGETTQEERTEIYRLISELSSKYGRADEHSDFLASDDSIMVPIMSGAKLDGVLCLFDQANTRLTSREAVLITVITNIISSYLHNLEYLESVSHHRDTSVKISHLDSGKAVKGVLDKRIVSSQHT